MRYLYLSCRGGARKSWSALLESIQTNLPSNTMRRSIFHFRRERKRSSHLLVIQTARWKFGDGETDKKARACA